MGWIAKTIFAEFKMSSYINITVILPGELHNLNNSKQLRFRRDESPVESLVVGNLADECTQPCAKAKPVSMRNAPKAVSRPNM